MGSHQIKALCFDVFGTVTDWYTSVSKEGRKISQKTGIDVPWGEFVLKWRRDGYMAAIAKIASGEMPITPTATINRTKLVSLLEEYGVTGLTTEEIEHLNLSWNRLDAWEDVVPGLGLLKKNHMIMPFSNGDYRCLIDIARHNALPWDGIISADFFKKVKPDPTIYQNAINLLQLPADQVLMVACHAFDLEMAKQAGMKIAYVSRPLEYGPNVAPEDKPVQLDYDVSSFVELAQVLAQ
jgi:2-haloacid dehalogenase